MRYAKKALITLGCTAVMVALLVGASPVFAAKHAVSTSAAHARVVSLTRELREARYVEDKTREHSATYGASVGRWVWLARSVGWHKHDMARLMYVIYRESRGNPRATNPSSGAAGLLQFMPQWYTGQWSFPAFDPYNPKVNLTMGCKLQRQQGWTPWSL